MSVGITALAASFLLGLLLTPAGAAFARRLSVLRRPEGESIDKQPTVPVAGGPVILIVVTAVVAALVWLGAIPSAAGAGVLRLAGGLAGAAVICVVGVVADGRGL